MSRSKLRWISKSSSFLSNLSDVYFEYCNSLNFSIWILLASVNICPKSEFKRLNLTAMFCGSAVNQLDSDFFPLPESFKMHECQFNDQIMCIKTAYVYFNGFIINSCLFLWLRNTKVAFWFCFSCCFLLISTSNFCPTFDFVRHF